MLGDIEIVGSVEEDNNASVIAFSYTNGPAVPPAPSPSSAIPIDIDGSGELDHCKEELTFRITSLIPCALILVSFLTHVLFGPSLF